MLRIRYLYKCSKHTKPEFRRPTSDSTKPGISRMEVSRRRSRLLDGIPQAFSMATRPIRQPPSRVTYPVCVNPAWPGVRTTHAFGASSPRAFSDDFYFFIFIFHPFFPQAPADYFVYTEVDCDIYSLVVSVFHAGQSVVFLFLLPLDYGNPEK